MTWFSCQLDECPASWKGWRCWAVKALRFLWMSRNRTWVFLGISMQFRFCKYRDDAIAWSLNLNHGVFCLELKPMTFIKHAYQLDPVFFGTLCSRLWAMWEWMLAAKRLGCGALWTFEFVGPLACLVIHVNINASNRWLDSFLNMFQHFLVSSVLDKIVLIIPGGLETSKQTRHWSLSKINRACQVHICVRKHVWLPCRHLQVSDLIRDHMKRWVTWWHGEMVKIILKENCWFKMRWQMRKRQWWKNAHSGLICNTKMASPADASPLYLSSTITCSLHRWMTCNIMQRLEKMCWQQHVWHVLIAAEAWKQVKFCMLWQAVGDETLKEARFTTGFVL